MLSGQSVMGVKIIFKISLKTFGIIRKLFASLQCKKYKQNATHTITY
jgi:hypothetical protein